MLINCIIAHDKALSGHILFTLTAIILIFSSIFIVYASNTEKGNPAANYYPEKIVLSNGNEVELTGNTTLLFLNGTIITDYEVIIRNDRALVPLRLIAQEFGASVDWDGSKRKVTILQPRSEIILTIDDDIALINGIETALDYPVIIYRDLTYVPLRFIAVNFNASIEYSSQMSPEYTYYYDTLRSVSPANTIVRDFANIIIDEKYDFSNSPTVEEAMAKTKKLCNEGLKNFIESMRERLINSNGDPNGLNSDFEIIKREIDRMLYIDEVSRFYKFTMSPYDILYDRLNGRVFFIIYSSGTIIKEVDVHDPGLYLLIFIVG